MIPPAVALREAVRGDAGAIAAVNVQAWREAYDGLMPPSIMAALSVERSAAKWADAFAMCDRPTVHVAGTDGRIVGYIVSGPQRSEGLRARYSGEIEALYVLAAFHRMGIARALIAIAGRALAVQGHVGAALWTLRDNLGARAFYEALGGAPVAARAEPRDGHVIHEVAYGWAAFSRPDPHLGARACRHLER